MSRCFTIRAFVVGTLLSLAISVGFSYARLVYSTAGMSSDYITAGALFLFFLLTAAANPLLKLVRRSWGFERGELVVIYVMMIVASTIPTWGFSGNLVSMLPAVYYYATPENNWAELLHPHIRPWMVIQDSEAIQFFYEGLPAGRSIPWAAWLMPLAAWGSFIVAIYLMMIAMMVLVRRQWVEHERLLFPLVQLPLDMTEESGRGGAFSGFVKSPLMWLGFLIPFCLLSTYGLHFYFPVVPKVNLYEYIPFPSLSTGLEFHLVFTVLGLAYFLSVDVAVSLWLFHLLATLQMGLQNAFGYRLSGDIEHFMEGTLMLAHQGMGAMLVLIVFGLWTGRGHLQAAWRRIWDKNAGIDDSAEILSYRVAALILLLGGLYVTGWLYLSGIPLWVTLIFLLVAFGIFLFMARLIAEGGLGFIRPQMPAQPIVINFLGTDAVTAPGIHSLAMTFSWAGNVRILLMASAINSMKLAAGVGALRRPLFWAMLLAILASLGSSIWLIIWLGYQYGGANLDGWFYQYMGQGTHTFAAYKINNPVNLIDTFDIIGPRMLYTGVGGAVMSLLIYARHHFLWWPVHYLGFAVSATNMTSGSWFSIFLGSIIKAIVLQYGGIQLYKALRPFFLGCILGQVVCSGLWALIDVMAGGRGNFVPVFTHHF